MRTWIQAFLLSALVHSIFFLGPILIGFVQTSFYKPDHLSNFQTVEYIQNEVAFGMIITPLGYLSIIASFLVVSLVFGALLILYKRWKKN
ncbi:hypothetical protein [Bacillus sp. V59.32b]|uniref:hypothetical protein n=1 Tax=Bacillus sp. V59.32b TaxID=1758642 RepID=UPI000E3D7351|nr:hypothetical protein [Bacillus sp. V59.32b]RFU60515.1 hypothetical protein D0463_16765 [Bacillus sp. V59.32b]